MSPNLTNTSGSILLVLRKLEALPLPISDREFSTETSLKSTWGCCSNETFASKELKGNYKAFRKELDAMASGAVAAADRRHVWSESVSLKYSISLFHYIKSDD